MIWSNFVAGSALMAIAASAVTRSARPRISATMISLPSPFIFKNGALDMEAAFSRASGLYGGERGKLPVVEATASPAARRPFLDSPPLSLYQPRHIHLAKLLIRRPGPAKV